MHIDYDDGFIAYLNGQEVARANIGTAGDPVYYNQFADSDHEAVMYNGGKPEKFDIGFAKSYLKNGENVLAIEVHNKSNNSSDMSLIPFLSFGFSESPNNSLGTLPILGLKSSYNHTNFKINNNGESLFLTSSQGDVIDSVANNPIPKNISYGRIPDGGSVWNYFDKPTPGYSNNDNGSIKITLQSEMPTFSHHRNFYDTQFQLTLTSNSIGAKIRYTTDCTKPTRDYGILYTKPIEISKTTTVRAVEYEDTTLTSKVKTHSYVFLNDVLTQDNSDVPEEQNSSDHVFWTEEFDMNDVSISDDEMEEALLDLPTIYVSAPWDSIFGISGIHRGQNLEEYSGAPHDPNWKEIIECSVEMIYPENYRGGRLNNWQENCGIKIQGGASRWNNGEMDHKQSFTLVFKSQYGKSKLKNPILITAPFNSESVPSEFDKIILRTGFNRDFGSDWDRANYAYTRDQFARDLQTMMSGWGNHGTYTNLYINGKYWGITNPSERMDDNALATYFGGDSEDYFYGKGKGGVLFGSPDRYNHLIHTDWTNRPLSEIEKYLVLDPYIDIVLLHGYGNIGDGAQYYFGGRINPPGPIYYTGWDMEDSFDGGARRSGPPVAIENLQSIYSGDKFLAYYKMKNNIDFKMKFADRLYKHCYNDGILTDSRVTAIWDSSCSVLAKSMYPEIARWGDERGEVFDHDHWEQECNDVHKDLIGRAEKYIEEEKKVGMYPNIDPPIFNDGSNVITTNTIDSDANFHLTITMLFPPGKIYYTKDGSDPRSWDLTGNVSASAIDGDGSVTIPITEVTTIKARIKNENTWSPLHELKIIPHKTSQIVINEINYDSTPNFDTDDWVEIYNNSENDISLAGWKLKDSDTTHIFKFDQNTVIEKKSFLVVCRDTSAFIELFQNVENYVGNMDFKLGNSGDSVRIFDTDDNLIDIVSYNNDLPWPLAAAGKGSTLELRNPEFDNSKVESWSASKGFGTPGQINSEYVVTDVNDKKIEQQKPNSFQLLQNYPNPFNPTTNISYHLLRTSEVELSIFNLLGQKVATLISERQNAGSYQVEWNATRFASGIYFYRIKADDFIDTKKMILLK